MKSFSCALIVCVIGALPFTVHAGVLRSAMRVDSIPRNLSPQNDTVFRCIPGSVVLRWSPGTSFDNSYFIELSSDSTFENPIVSEVVIINTSFVCPVPQSDTTLYWRVRTQFDTTAIWRFTLRRPSVPTAFLPASDTVTDNPVKFVWSGSAGGDRTELLIEGEAYTRRDTVAADTAHYVTLLGFKTYTWRVRTLCGDGHGDWSASRSFYLNTVTNSVSLDPVSASPVVADADPSSSMLVLRHREGASLGTVRILSMIGTTVATADAEGASVLSVDIRALASGVYFLVGESGSGRWSSRLQVLR
ncbi:MAG: T9SS type A sorting domain-containing protein [Candidatus Kapaibacterium sp.]